MIMLGIDTCGPTATLALASFNPTGQDYDRGEHPAGKTNENRDEIAIDILATAELAGRATAANLIPEIQRLLAEAELALRDLAGIVVVDGPGSFTGIRVGLSTAKGLAEAAELPVYPISRLCVLASVHRQPSQPAAFVLLDAGRGEFYYGSYPPSPNPTAPDPQAEENECLLTREELLLKFADAGTWIVCEEKLLAACPQALLVPQPIAANALQAALPQVLARRSANIQTLDGRYLRRSDLYHTTSARPT